MKILLVDDNPDIVELVSMALAGFGNYDVTTALSGECALGILQTAAHPFDCFLLDIQMPGMSGIELCSHIRKHGRYRHSPIVMITAMKDKEHLDAAFGAGATDYIDKPFGMTELVHRVDLAIRASFSFSVLSEAGSKLRIKDPPPAREEPSISLDDAVPIDDLDGVIHVTAFENYLKQLGRMRLRRTALLVVTVRNIEQIFRRCSGREFADQLSDIAEAITRSLAGARTPLLSYFGKGLYAIAADRQYLQDPRDLETAIRDALFRLQLTYRNGDPVRVQIGVSEVDMPGFFLLESGAHGFIDGFIRDLTGTTAQDRRMRR